jgi:spore coat protein U-like protein
MKVGTEVINYSLYSDSGRTTNWGNTVGTDTVAATGNGSAQAYTVYGRIPPQTTPAPGTYTDTITVTVTY